MNVRNACIKTNGGEIFIKTKRLLEKMGVETLALTHGERLLVAIDYFTKLIKCKQLENKKQMK